MKMDDSIEALLLIQDTTKFMWFFYNLIFFIVSLINYHIHLYKEGLVVVKSIILLSKPFKSLKRELCLWTPNVKGSFLVWTCNHFLQV